MNVFNKFLVILLALVGIFFWSTAVFVVWVLPGELVLALRDTASLLRGNVLLFQGLVTAFGVSSIVVALLILAGEFSAQEPSMVKLAQVSGGTATVSVEAIAQSVKSDLEQVPQVRMARPRIKNLGNAVEVLVELRTDPHVHLPTKAEEVCLSVRQTVEERLGVSLKEVKVTIQPDAPARLAGLAPRRATEVTQPGEILVPGALASSPRSSEPEEPPGTPRS